MKKFMKTLFVGIAVLGLGFMIMNTNAQESSDVYLEVTEWNLTITASGSIDLGAMPVSTTDVEMSGQFSTNSFYVTDFKGSTSGYYTTIQVTDLTWDNGGTTYTIPAANVELKSNAANPDLMTGTANASVTLGSITTTYSAIDSAITYFERNSGTVWGILSQYGDTPWIKVTVPAFQAPAQYHGVITFTLYEPGN